MSSQVTFLAAGLVVLSVIATWSAERVDTSDATPHASESPPNTDPARARQHAPATAGSATKAEAVNDNGSTRQLEAELMRLRDQLAIQRQHNSVLRRRLDTLLSRPESASAVETISCADDAEEDAMVELALEAERQQHQLTSTRHAELLDATLADEDIDTATSDQLYNRVAELIETHGLADATLLDVVCGDSLCRVELAHPDHDARDRFVAVSTLLFEASPEGFIHHIEQNDGSHDDIIYLATDGFALPSLDSGNI